MVCAEYAIGGFDSSDTVAGALQSRYLNAEPEIGAFPLRGVCKRAGRRFAHELYDTIGFVALYSGATAPWGRCPPTNSRGSMIRSTSLIPGWLNPL